MKPLQKQPHSQLSKFEKRERERTKETDKIHLQERALVANASLFFGVLLQILAGPREAAAGAWNAQHAQLAARCLHTVPVVPWCLQRVHLIHP